MALPEGAPEVLKAVTNLSFGDLAKFVDVRETTFTEGALQHAQTQVQDAAGPYLSTLDFDLRTGEILATGATAEDVKRVRSAISSLQEPLTAAGVVVKQGVFEDANGAGHSASSCVNAATRCPTQQSGVSIGPIALIGLAGLAMLLILWRGGLLHWIASSALDTQRSRRRPWATHRNAMGRVLVSTQNVPLTNLSAEITTWTLLRIISQASDHQTLFAQRVWVHR